jgi:Integrin beta chain VWA domain
MTSSQGDRGDAARQALAELLGSNEIDIVGETTGRLPSGEEVRQVNAAVRGEPNRTASVVVDASGEAQPLRRLEALYGRGFLAAGAVRERPALTPTPVVTIDPPTNEWTLPECVTEDETVTVFVPKSAVPPKADVYLLADTTGSMFTIIGAVQSGIDTVINAFPGLDVAWGVGNYKDFPIPGSSPYAFEHQLSPTTDLTAVHNAVNTWSADFGSDTPEGQLYALTKIATDPAIGWRAGSKRILVWFGDAPGHDPICTAISGAATDITEGTATVALQNALITVVAVSTDTGTNGALDGDPTAENFDYGVCTIGGSPGQATRIAGATGGSHTTGVDATTIIATLTSLISAAVQSINHLVLQPTGAIAPFVTSIAPPSYDSLAGDVDHTLPFDVTWTGVVDCADDDQVFTGSLDVVADGTVVASKPVTITVPACRWHHSTEMICGLQRGRDDDDKRDECQTVVDGRYATAVTIYNPSTCNVTLVKYFAPLILDGKPVGREPRTVLARPFAKLLLGPGEATLEDCCSLQEAVGPTGGPLVLGVLDIVADHALDVTVTHTANGAGDAATSVNARTIRPRRG